MQEFAAHGRPTRGEKVANSTAPGAPCGAWGAPTGRPAGFGVRFRIASAGRALRIRALGFGGGFGDLPNLRAPGEE